VFLHRENAMKGLVTPTFYKNKIFANIEVHIGCIPVCCAYEKLSKKILHRMHCIAWHGILYVSKTLVEPRRI
jgi:hypothetical protein